MSFTLHQASLCRKSERYARMVFSAKAPSNFSKISFIVVSRIRKSYINDINYIVNSLQKISSNKLESCKSNARLVCLEISED